MFNYNQACNSILTVRLGGFCVLVQKWKKDYEPSTINIDNKTMFQVKCADCGCLPEECKISPSAKECPNCSWDECCCWETITSR